MSKFNPRKQGKRDPKEEKFEGKEDKGKKLPGYQSLRAAAANQASAINAKKAIYDWKFQTVGEYQIDDEAIIVPYAVQHVGVELGIIKQDYLDDHKADIEIALRRVASAYNLSITDVNMDDLLTEMCKVITGSENILAIVATMHKMQNRQLLLDAEGRPLNKIFNCCTDDHKTYGTKEILDTDVRGEWTFSNADWRRLVIQPLDYIYLRKEYAQAIVTLFNNAIQLKESDDATVRYADFIPIEFTTDITDRDSLLSTLNTYVRAIKDAFNKYAFLQPLFETLGMSYDKYSADFDFTRDLAGSHFNAVVDTDNAIYDMIYSITAARLNEDEDPERESSSFCVINMSEFESSFTTTNGPREVTRILAEIRTLTNALRGNVRALNTCAQYYAKGTESALEIQDIHMTPFFVNSTEDAPQITLHKLHIMNIGNRLWAYLDLPASGVSVRVVDFAVEDGVIDFWHYQNILGVGDFVLASGDIEAIISSAAYDLVFGSSLEDYLSAVPTVNTLGK